MSLKLCSTIVLLFIVILASSGEEIDFSANPNCTQECVSPWIIYGHSQRKDESTHYLFGAVDTPTFMMMSGSANSSLKIDWTAIKYRDSQSVNISSFHNLFGFSLLNIILFNDVNDTGTMDNIPSNEKITIPTSDFKWRFYMPETSNATEYPIYFSSTSFQGTEFPTNSRISINLTSYTKNGRGQSLPHLLVSPDSTLFEISLDDMFTALNKSSLSSLVSNFTKPRFGLDMLIFGSKDASSFSVMSSKSLDDEHTPGIFSIDEIVSQAGSSNESGFMQWRPVAYLTTDRNINFATRPNLNKTLTPADKSQLYGSQDSLLFYLFGYETHDFSATQTTISFGRQKDGFYTAFNYTLWAFSFGLDNPPREGFSTSVILIISIGTGVPIILIAVAALYWIVSKRRRL